MYTWNCENISDRINEILVGSSLPFCCSIALYVVFRPLWWSSIYWWEQMREVLVVNKGEMILLH